MTSVKQTKELTCFKPILVEAINNCTFTNIFIRHKQGSFQILCYKYTVEQAYIVL